MWKDYSADYIRNNRANSISVRAAAFIAALFLSLLCSLFYDFWLDNIEGIKQEDGEWHGRITGEIGEDDLNVIRRFANVERVSVNEELSEGRLVTAEICFYDMRAVYQDMKAITDKLGLHEEAADYNYQLLAQYFIRIPGDEKPRLLMPFYLTIVAVVCLSLILVIHNSFAVSMNSRIHQFGIFSSIGAAPGQILLCLLQEAFMLSAVPAIAGIVVGYALSAGVIRVMSSIALKTVGGRMAEFHWSAIVLVFVTILSFLTIVISAWIPARKLSRLTPLEAIRGTSEPELKRKKSARVLSWLFGIEGELAGNALKAQRRALRTTSLSLTLAFSGFMVAQCYFTLSGISTEHTYFERYQDAWDVMVTVKDTRIEDFKPVGELQRLPEADSCVIYQKAEAVCLLPRESQSRELLALGGIEAYAESVAPAEGGALYVKSPIVILEDNGFEEFCRQIGVESGSGGTILLNKFWDSHHSNFRYPEYVPFVKENMDTVVLQRAPEAGYKAADDSGCGTEAESVGSEEPDQGVEIPVLACTQVPPVLREEYAKADYPLVQFMPLSLWKEISGQTGGAKKDIFVRLLAKERTREDAIYTLEDEVQQIVSQEYETVSENRIQEKITNDEMIRGYELLMGVFCTLLAVIGIAQVFSNTLGFLRQRKREFARYMSVGLTPEGIRKMFCIEAALVVGRPLAAALLLTVMASGCMIAASYLDPMEFIMAVPAIPILLFVLAVFGCIALAYYLGGRKILAVSLADALRDDMML